MPDKQLQHLATEWVTTYSDELLRFALIRVRDESLAKDLVQDCLLAAWNHIEEYNGTASVKTWLISILKNKIIDHYRKASTRLTDQLLQQEENADPFFDTADHWSKGYYPREMSFAPEDPVEAKEFHSILGLCRKKLKSLQNAVFSLKYLDGLESETICKELGISPSNYWVLIHRAKVQLRACIETKWLQDKPFTR